VSRAFSINPERLAEIVHTFSGQKILIVGDVIADQFVYGAIARVSREAPVFILRHEQTATLAGGAANAAVNVAALGGASFIIGVVGADAAGDELKNVLVRQAVETNFLLEAGDWRTTTKMRVFAGQPHSPRQQVIRLDYENDSPLSERLQRALAANLCEAAAAGAAAIVVSDYDYGAASNSIVRRTIFEIAEKRNLPIFIDSRRRLFEFAGATAATPNETEVEELLEKKFDHVVDLARAGDKLRERLKLKSLLVTRGASGMLLLEQNKDFVELAAVGSLEAVDVTGAGDTVMAAFALALASGANFVEAAAVANHAGGLVVMKRGTATISPAELIKSIKA
jgi:rfaE bifunctional protein kinase chain/domain